MPRPIVLSNGRLYVGIDRFGTVRELCWPNVGYPNHLVDGGIRLGVWVDGEFSWLDSGEWEISVGIFKNERLKIEIQVLDRVTDEDGFNWQSFFSAPLDSHSNLGNESLFVRKIRLRNHSQEKRAVKLFQTHCFHIDESDIGNTAFFDSQKSRLLHYKNNICIQICSCTESIAQWACGTQGFDDLEGTWRDAEDGMLSEKSIEQGRVDSTICFEEHVECFGRWEFEVVFSLGRSFEHCSEVYEEYVRNRKGPSLINISDEFDVFLEREFSRDLKSFVWESRKQVLNHCDLDGGILAACDSDIMETARANYNYVWFRDGALVGNTLAETGHRDRAQRFWEFFLRCVGDREWAFQKYTVRGDVGASWMPWVVDGEPVVPFQQDESALPVWLGLKWGLEGGRETCERFLNHMVEYRDANGLPGQSWDLWEERRGVHFWTTATVIEALFAGAEAGFDRSEEYREAGEKMVAAVREHFWDRQYECLARTIYPDGEGGYKRDLTPDASILLGLMHGRLGEVEGWLAGMVHRAENELAVRSSVGGIARYPGDYYFRRSEEYPGNPWVICTLWLARAKMLLAGSVEEAEGIAREAFSWCVERAESTYVLAEQFHPDTGEPLSVSPLTWSHAEVLDTALLLDRLKGG